MACVSVCSLGSICLCTTHTDIDKIIYNTTFQRKIKHSGWVRTLHVESVVRRVVPSCTTSRRPHLSAPFTATRTSGSRSGPLRAVWLWVRAVSWVRCNTPGEPQRAAPRSPCARALHAARQAVPQCRGRQRAASPAVECRAGGLTLGSPGQRRGSRAVGLRGGGLRGVGLRGRRRRGECGECGDGGRHERGDGGVLGGDDELEHLSEHLVSGGVGVGDIL